MAGDNGGFTEAEIATIRKFFDWISASEWLGEWSSTGILGADDRGVQLVEFSADEYSLGRDESFISWLALTDPDEYERQLLAAQAAQRAADEQRQRDYTAREAARERALYDQLRAKFEGKSA